jgi:hypothetical protein
MLAGTQVSYRLADGSTARATYDAGTIEGVEALLAQKRETGQLLMVDELDDLKSGDLFINVHHIVAVVVVTSFDVVQAAG